MGGSRERGRGDLGEYLHLRFSTFGIISNSQEVYLDSLMGTISPRVKTTFDLHVKGWQKSRREESKLRASQGMVRNSSAERQGGGPEIPSSLFSTRNQK